MSTGQLIGIAHFLGMPKKTKSTRSQSPASFDGPRRADRAAKSASSMGSNVRLVAGKSNADRPGNPHRFAHLAPATHAFTPAPAPVTTRQDAETPDAVARRSLAAAGIATTPLSMPTVASKPPTYATADAAACAMLKAAGLAIPK